MIQNTNSTYGVVSILNHWLGGLLFLGIVAMGFYMTLLPRSPLKEQLLMLHQSLSVVLIAFVIIRILWKFMTPMPNIIRSYPLWEMILAKIVHSLLFLTLISVPLSGWLLNNARGEDLMFFSYLVLPRITGESIQSAEFALNLHLYLTQGFLVLLFLHLMGSIKHHWIDKDNTLRRILRPEKLWFNR
jgi:cytochrome b561